MRPEPDALTINTGDMAQIYSNNRYHAPEHRVLTNPLKPRYSAPFFYNPAYAAAVAPLPSLGAAQFDELVWGYFRAQRFAGDFADYGTEIQISDFAKGSGSWHVHNQARFLLPLPLPLTMTSPLTLTLTLTRRASSPLLTSDCPSASRPTDRCSATRRGFNYLLL